MDPFWTYLPTHIRFSPILKTSLYQQYPIFVNLPTYQKIGYPLWMPPLVLWINKTEKESNVVVVERQELMLQIQTRLKFGNKIAFNLLLLDRKYFWFSLNFFVRVFNKIRRRTTGDFFKKRTKITTQTHMRSFEILEIPFLLFLSPDKSPVT